MAPTIVRSALSVFFEYDTPRIVHIRSKKVGVINRFLQICIISYIIGFAIVYKKGYQEFDDVNSAVTTKLKGVALTNLTDEEGINGTRVWDVADYVIPPQENNAFFVTTNLIVTPAQQQDICEESPSVEDGICSPSKPCIPNTPVVNGNGIKTGECIKSSRNESVNVCMIYAWCPVEKDAKPAEPVLLASQNFTVFIKNNIKFPKFNVSRRNLPDSASDTFLQSCRYANDAENKTCPIFQLAQIVGSANQDYRKMAEQGGVVQILIQWNCNLDYSQSECVPEYQFRRLDSDDYKVSKGFNFRYAENYIENGVSKRTLIKAYGIRFIVTVEGRAGKFNVVPLILNVGSGIALLSVATIICDIVVLYFLKARYFFREKKYLDVKGTDAYETLDEERDDKSGSVTRRKSATSSDLHSED
ncbi:hypothetical protein LOTGIDRAFT_207736 [Lottia gigantea]|uniref:Uncharacterized protein n=1 Tax=Lottia gigantea TaxID=225164 RepID=V4B103_LOTGI|nr:hypothetical protein LOTGIDRAFT_207736 [Lottia gigantea]ESP00966.1 hypothetical protein LOTGIDRAFT_207736 [Lottia gigantea]